MTRLIDAIPFLKGAVQRAMPGGMPARYVFHGGRAYAQSPAILASYPLPHLGGTFALAADELEGALSRMPGEPTVGGEDGRMVLRSGRLVSRLDLLACDPPEGDVDPTLNWEPTPPGLFAALKVAQGFVAKEGTWQRSVRLRDGFVTALNNRSACEVTVPGLEVLEEMALVDDCVGYLVKLAAAPAKWYKASGGAALFLWPTDLDAESAWVRCQLAAVPWPDDIFERIMEKAGAEAPVAMTEDWRDSYEDIAALGDGTCEVRPGGLHGRSPHGEHTAEFDTGVAVGAKFAIDALKAVVACASAWNPNPIEPSLFVNADGTIRGCIAGMR
jgi:hypothetical protein